MDLFGEETEEEKKAAEECAAAVKASGKKKECKLVFILYESFATKSISIIFLVQIHLRSSNRLYMFLILNR